MWGVRSSGPLLITDASRGEGMYDLSLNQQVWKHLHRRQVFPYIYHLNGFNVNFDTSNFNDHFLYPATANNNSVPGLQFNQLNNPSLISIIKLYNILSLCDSCHIQFKATFANYSRRPVSYQCSFHVIHLR